jgi:sigma-B regulation protein RsbU (phosphoserine phosphatase)
VALADVSGKGVPAALLMASLQASLRGQVLDGAADLARLMERINRLVHDASPENRYATFFYGQYDPAARRLDYVNAGHNPPLLLARDGGGLTLKRLTAGGMVVGLLPGATYAQASELLPEGSLLLGFTDGVSEAMNALDEEWGEERLIEAVREGTDLPLSELLSRILARADRFVDGSPQHDDMTLVAMRV